VRDYKFWQMQMHLDTHFNIIDKDLCTMVRSRYEALPGSKEFNTCDIWARKPGTKEYTLQARRHTSHQHHSRPGHRRR
jgi:arginine deiminase